MSSLRPPGRSTTRRVWVAISVAALIAAMAPGRLAVAQTTQSVTNFTLINADTDLPVAGFNPIPSGATINLTLLPTSNLNIRANTTPSTVGSVRFGLDAAANFSTDNAVPYALAGGSGGNYAPWTPTLGSHTVTGTPFTRTNARGTAGKASSVTFLVTSTDSQPPVGAVVINNGAAVTSSTTTTLTLSATDNSGTVSQMRFSDTGVTFAAAESYATTKTWTLSAGDGVRTVYVQYSDAAGNWSPSVSDTIILDTVAPALTAVQATGVTTTSATIRWTTDEPSTSQVDYGTTTAFGNATVNDTVLTTSHVRACPEFR